MFSRQLTTLISQAYNCTAREFRKTLAKETKKHGVTNSFLVQQIDATKINEDLTVVNVLHALLLGKNWTIFESFITENPEFLVTIYEGETLFGWVTLSGDIDKFRQLIQLCNRINQRACFEIENAKTFSPLALTLFMHRIDMATMLIEEGVDLTGTIPAEAQYEGKTIKYDAPLARVVPANFPSLARYFPTNEVGPEPASQLAAIMTDHVNINDQPGLQYLAEWQFQPEELFTNIREQINSTAGSLNYECTIFTYACLTNESVALRILESIEQRFADAQNIIDRLFSTRALSPLGLTPIGAALSLHRYQFAFDLADKYNVPINPFNEHTGLNLLHEFSVQGQWEAASAIARKDRSQLSIRSADIDTKQRGWLPFHYAAATLPVGDLDVDTIRAIREQMDFLIDGCEKASDLMKIAVPYEINKLIINCTPIHLLILKGQFPRFIERAQAKRLLDKAWLWGCLVHESEEIMAPLEFAKQYGNEHSLKAFQTAGLIPPEKPEKPLRKTNTTIKRTIQPVRENIDTPELFSLFKIDTPRKKRPTFFNLSNHRKIKNTIHDQREDHEKNPNNYTAKEIKEMKDGSTQYEDDWASAAFERWIINPIPWTTIGRTAKEKHIEPSTKPNTRNTYTEVDTKLLTLPEMPPLESVNKLSTDNKATVPITPNSPAGLYDKQKYPPHEHRIQDSDIPKYVHYIAEKLGEKGYTTYLVGGALRDLLISKQSINKHKLNPSDWDLLTDAPVDKILELFRSNAKLVSTRLSLIHISLPEAGMDEKTKSVEISTLQKGPVLQKLEDNAKARDFSFNALFYNLTPKHLEKGIVYDFFAGLAAISKMEITTIGDPNTSFSYDACRIYRAVRFLSKLKPQGNLENNTHYAMWNNLHRLGHFKTKDKSILYNSSRSFGEVLKLLIDGYAIPNMEILWGLGLRSHQVCRFSNPLLHFVLSDHSAKIALSRTDDYVSKYPSREKEAIAGYLLAELIKPQFLFHNGQAMRWGQSIDPSELILFLCSEAFGTSPYTWMLYKTEIIKNLVDSISETFDSQSTSDRVQNGVPGRI